MTRLHTCLTANDNVKWQQGLNIHLLKLLPFGLSLFAICIAKSAFMCKDIFDILKRVEGSNMNTRTYVDTYTLLGT